MTGRFRWPALYAGLWLCCGTALGQDIEPGAVDEDEVPSDTEVVELSSGETLTEKQVENIKLEAETSEDPDAARRIERETEARPEVKEFDGNVYGSVRIHAINAFREDTLGSEARLGDGASRIGATGSWYITPKCPASTCPTWTTQRFRPSIRRSCNIRSWCFAIRI